MILLDGVSVRYPGRPGPAVTGVDLHVPDGEMCLLVGPTGSGKSTVLRAVNGLVPHFSGGTLSGRVLVDGRDTRTHRPRDLADVVGFVGQDPTAGFVADVVEDEIAFGMEWLGLAPATMRRRVEESLDLLGLAELRRRPLETLSGGQRQRTAIAAAMAAHPRVLVLDEPTSALDPQAAEDVLAALQRLVHDLGVTLLMAEHRLERVIQYVDSVAVIEDGSVRKGDPAAMMTTSPVAPPVVELGRLLSWHPLPLSVRDARRRAADVLDPSHPSHGTRSAATGAARAPGGQHEAPARSAPVVTSAPTPIQDVGRRRRSGTTDAPLAELSKATVRYGAVVALTNVTLQLAPGDSIALMGRNGAGKSTLLHALVGLTQVSRGHARVSGGDPRTLRAPDLVTRVGLVPQQPTDILYGATVEDECAAADRDAGLPPGTSATVLAELAPDIDASQHPRDLSEGQRLMLALAVVLAAEPPVVLLDEPTRGLDYQAKRRLVTVIRRLSTAGHAVLLSTHDVELAAEACARVVVLAQGEVVADGPMVEVVTASPVFAPQVAKVMAPQPWLTVHDVADALGAA